MLNVSKLLGELQQLTIYPEKWDQGFWAVPAIDPETKRPSACGSYGCIAGNTLIHNEYTLIWKENPMVGYFDEASQDRHRWIAEDAEDSNGNRRTIEAHAAKELGLTPWQAEILFDPDNTEADLWEHAERFSGGQISDWDYRLAKESRAARALRESK